MAAGAERSPSRRVRDCEAGHIDTGVFGESGHGVPLARSPESVREPAMARKRAVPHLDRMRGAFGEQAAVPDGRVQDFDVFVDLLTE